MAAFYTQTWAAGNSTFTSVSPYNAGVDGADPLYPEMQYAELVTVTGNGLEFKESLRSGVATYQEAGIRLGGMTAVAPVGSITAIYTPTSVSLADLAGGNAALIALHSTYSPSPLVADMSLEDRGGGTWVMVVNYVTWSGSGNVEFAASAPVATTPYTFKLCWKLGTPVGLWTDVNADGYVRVYQGGTLLGEVTGIPLYADNDTEIGGGTFGDAGLLGPLSSIVFSDSECLTIPPNGSTPCCGDKTPPTGPGTPGGLPPENPYQALPPWASTCAGGGVVPTATDLTDSEAWA